jgi:hypothetical protein
LLKRPDTAHSGFHLRGFRLFFGRAQARRGDLPETARQVETFNKDETD